MFIVDFEKAFDMVRHELLSFGVDATNLRVPVN